MKLLPQKIGKISYLCLLNCLNSVCTRGRLSLCWLNNTPRRAEVQLHTFLTSKPVEVYSHFLALSATGRRQESAWAAELVWAFCITEKYISFAGNRTPTRRSSSRSPLACLLHLQHIDMTSYRTSGKAECNGFVSKHDRSSGDTAVCQSPVPPPVYLSVVLK